MDYSDAKTNRNPCVNRANSLMRMLRGIEDAAPKSFRPRP